MYVMKGKIFDIVALVVGGMVVPYVVECLMMSGDVEEWLKSIFSRISGWCFLVAFVLFRLSYHKLFEERKWWKGCLYFIWIYWGVFGVVAGVMILAK